MMLTHRIVGRFAALALVALPSLALAQVPTIDPSGRTPIAAPPPAAAPAAPITLTNQPGGESSGGGETGFYHTDGVGEMPSRDGDSQYTGLTPETHVVRKGDTLWDICWYYFNNPWEWPKVWSYNPAITNPHWIYPGDLVRLFQQGLGPVVEAQNPDSDVDVDVRPAPIKRQNVKLKQYTFVERKKLEEDGTVRGSVDEKSMLATGDTIYLDYPKGNPPEAGKRYSVYTESNTISSPQHGNVGSYVRIIGEVEVISVKEEKRARAVVTASNSPIERGHRVGEIQKDLGTIEPVANKVDAQGQIVGLISQDALVGAGQVVIVDLGSESGIKAGNRAYVVRRGDAFKTVMGPTSNVGQNDERFPARALGEIIFVQVGKTASIGLVTLSVQEMGRGDMVMMQKSR